MTNRDKQVLAALLAAPFGILFYQNGFFAHIAIALGGMAGAGLTIIIADILEN